MQRFLWAAIAAASLLSACGGGGNSGDTKSDITSVKVVGASLADSGTFGYKFTVQSGGTTAYKVYTERLASTFGVSGFCNAYSSSDGSTFSSNSGCTNYAVAGARVNYTVTSGSTVTAYDSVPVSQIQQLVDAGNAGFTSKDLLVVGEASANDMATVLSALSNSTEFAGIMLTLLDSTTFATAMANDSTGATAGVLYFQALADKLVDAVVTNAIDKGAEHVAVLNILDVTRTPRFQAVLASLSTANATALSQLATAWINAYNTRLATDVASYSSKMVVVDFYTSFNDEMDSPAQYGLSNVSHTVCDEVVTGGTSPGVTSLATLSTVGACTDTSASSITPSAGADGTTTWWKKYLYADNFHPTPYGHQLLAQMVAKRLTEAGWL
ncbi:SGNH/GDSL hydrolase family protein [Aquabacterium sp.]|uniref:SGNH/GDSL hydrolase family protein n=1 Tax=Aquabacterium sp. TaxID=1872578 RepID=UPI0035B239BC